MSEMTDKQLRTLATCRDRYCREMAAELLRRREAERQLMELCRIALTHCGPPDADYEEWELGYKLRAAIAKAEAGPSDPSPEPGAGGKVRS